MPAARRLAQLPDQYADGGLVARMKSADAGPAAFGSRGLNQLRELVPKVAAMGYPQQSQAPAPAPVSDPRAAQLMAMIPQMEAMGYKQKPQMLARGGMVRGPGTGTSDSIPDEAEPGTYIMPADSTAAIGPSALEKMGTVPVRLSDGEFKIPPEKVMAIGEAVLKLMKDATHTPVNGEDGGQTDAEVEDDDDKEGARGFNPAERMAQMPEQMFADGGSVGFQRVDVGQWAQDQDQWRDDLARFDARQAKARQDQEDADEEARRQVEAAKMRSGQSSQADQSAMTFADGGLVESNVTRVGNSYSGGNVGGNITVNGRAPNGGYMGAGNSAAGGQPPSPVGMSVDQAQSQGLIGGRVGYNPAYDQRLNGAPTAPRPAPTTISVTRGTPAVGTQDPAAGFASPVDRIATAPAPAPAPMGWQARQDQRSADVGAASITNRPEWRRYADGGMVHRLPLPPGYKPRGYFGGDTVVDDRQQQALANQTAMYVRGAQEAASTPAPTPVAAPAQPAGALTRAAGAGRGFTNPAAVTPGPAVEAMSGGLGFEPNAVTRTGNSYTGPANISGDVTINGGGPRNGGQISAQNMGAADSLARRGAAERMAEMPNAPQQVQAPMVRHSGNDWQARNDLRNALVSASSITNNGGRFDQTRGRNPAALAYQSALATDNALQASEPGLAAAAMKENSETNRSAMRERGLAAQALASERGAMDRTLITERGNNTRAGITALASTEAARLRAQQEGKAPPGYRWKADGGMEPIPGGPAASKVADDAKTRESGFDGSRQAIGTINRLLASPGRQGATGGWNLNRFIPGNQSADFAAEVETLKAQTFLPMIQQLRGMGALSNAEGDKINAAVGALNFNMSEPAFAESLGRIRDQLGSALQRSGVDTKDLANWGLDEPTSTATKPSGNAPAPSPAVTPTSTMKIDTQQAFAELPSGSRFIAPDGTTRIKP